MAFPNAVNLSMPSEDVPLSPSSSAYIPGLSRRQRVDRILQDLRDKHRWSFKDFIRYMVTEELNEPKARSATYRAEILVNAIYSQPEVVKKLGEVSVEFNTAENSGLVPRIQTELRQLQRKGTLAAFELEKAPAAMDIPGLAKRVQEGAPELWQLLANITTPTLRECDTSKAYNGNLVMLCSLLASTFAPIKSNSFPMLIGLYLHSMGVKRRVINFLAGLGICPNYQTLISKWDALAELGQKQLKATAQRFLGRHIICWDNFDYNQSVRHQALRDVSTHICATTGKLCIGQTMPTQGLCRSMFRPEVPLQPYHIYTAPPNSIDSVLQDCQRYHIAEAIRYCHRDAVEALFTDTQPVQIGPMKPRTCLVDWPEFPIVERLPPQKTEHHSLVPMLLNEGCIDGTYDVLKNIFEEQFGYKKDSDFRDLLQLIYGDQKTVALILAVMKERAEARSIYNRLGWVLPLPGLFHWRMNFLDMVFSLYSGDDHPAIPSTLHQNKVFLGCVQGHNSPFHHKEEVATRAFMARVTAMFYRFKPADIDGSRTEDIDNWIRGLSRSRFHEIVDSIREKLFDVKEQCDAHKKRREEPVDFEFSAHCKVVQQMETYLTLKLAIKFGDIGLIKRTFARCCLLFPGTTKAKYAFLSLYMTWLTHTDATSPELKRAILANGLVNLRGAADGWFEIDRLNELFNLQMKTLMVNRRSSTQEVHLLFRRTALSAAYSTELKQSLESAFGEYSNNRHQNKDASSDVRSLAYVISKSIEKQPGEHTQGFEPRDIVTQATGEKLAKAVDDFNQAMNAGMCTDKDENYDDLTPTSITTLEEIEQIGEEDNDFTIS